MSTNNLEIKGITNAFKLYARFALALITMQLLGSPVRNIKILGSGRPRSSVNWSRTVSLARGLRHAIGSPRGKLTWGTTPMAALYRGTWKRMACWRKNRAVKRSCNSSSSQNSHCNREHSLLLQVCVRRCCTTRIGHFREWRCVYDLASVCVVWLSLTELASMCFAFNYHLQSEVFFVSFCIVLVCLNQYISEATQGFSHGCWVYVGVFFQFCIRNASHTSHRDQAPTMRFSSLYSLQLVLYFGTPGAAPVSQASVF